MHKGIYPNIKKHLNNWQSVHILPMHRMGIHRTREERFFDEPKLICKGNVQVTPEFSFDDKKVLLWFFLFLQLFKKSSKYDLKLLLGLMNSNIVELIGFNKWEEERIRVDIGTKVFRLFSLPKY